MQESTIAAIRFGFGPRAKVQPRTPAEVIESLGGSDPMRARFPLPDTKAANALVLEGIQLRRDLRKSVPGAVARDKQKQREWNELRDSIPRRLLARVMDTETPLRERLTLFWMDHFATDLLTQAGAALGASFIDDALRVNMTGRFADMLRAVVTHPQMLRFLDQDRSVGPNSPVGKRRDLGLNENLARELMELHTLGVSASYTQDDVRELAELLTGLRFIPGKGGFRFSANWAEPGAETVLDQSYGGRKKATLTDIFTFLDDVSVHPDTAHHMAHKLAVHFVSDTPERALVDDVAQVWIASGGELKAVYRAFLEHPGAWRPDFTKAKQPFDFLASALLALEMTGEKADALDKRMVQRVVRGPLNVMGQPFMRPRRPDGWPEEVAAWITPIGLGTRLRWAMRMPRELGLSPEDPRSFARRILADTATERTLFAVDGAETATLGVALALLSPEFNRR